MDNQVDQNVTQSVQQPQQKPFNPAEIRRGYTAKQWEAKEDWYTSQVNAIVIPSDPSTADIQDIASQIDRLLTIARLDFAYISQNFDRYSTNLKIEERRLFVELKLNTPQPYDKLKLTVDDMKGVVCSVIKGSKWNGTQYGLYELVESASARNIFMEAVIKTLQDKKDLLITHSGMLKIEHSISSMSASVPKGSVPNG